MADTLQRLLAKSTLNLDKIKKSSMSFNKGILTAKSTIFKINQKVSETNVSEKENIRNSRVIFQKRRDAVRRRDQEDIIEASSIGGPIRRQSTVISRSTRGFFGRILEFSGTLLVGWLLNNLPTIISLGRQLIERIFRLVSILKSFLNNTLGLLTNFRSLLEGIFSNLSTFDFTDQSGKVNSALNAIQNNFSNMEMDINNAINLFSQPFDFGFESIDIEEGQTAPPAAPEGAVPEETIPDRSSKTTPSAESGGGKFKPLLDLISSGESPGAEYTAMFPSESYPQILNMSINEVISFQKEKLKDGRISAAIGRYQMLYPENFAKAAGLPLTAKFSPANQDKMVIAYLKKYRRLSEWEQGIISDEDLSEELAREFGAFKSASGYVLPGNTGSIGFNELKPVLKKVKSTPTPPKKSKSPLTTSPPSSPKSVSRTAVIDTVNIAKGGNGIVKLTPGQGFGAYRTPTRSHAGIDINTSGQTGWYVSFKLSGSVLFAGNSGGYGKLVIIKSGNTQYYFAHLRKILLRRGQAYNGENIGEIGNTGKSTGIHLHYEVRPNGNPVDPKSYLNLLSIGRETISISRQTSKTQQNIQPSLASNIKPTKTLRTPDTLKKPSPLMVIPIPQPEQQENTPSVSFKNPFIVSKRIKSELNSMAKKKFLLDLAYT